MTKPSQYCVLAFAGLLTLFGAACGPEQPTESADVDFDDVADDTAEHQGQEVVIEAHVDKVMSDCALHLTASDFPGGETVFTVCETTPPFIQRVGGEEPVAGDWVRVTGTPVEMTRVGYEQRAAVTVEAEAFGEQETAPVLMAKAIEVIEPREGSADDPMRD